MCLTEIGDGIFLADDPIVKIGQDDITFVKHEALRAKTGRARICAHRSNNDSLHEMMIAITSGSYIHPHKHVDKVESFHIIEGEVDVVVLDDDGKVREVVELGDASSARKFYYRLADSYFHTLLIHTDFLIVHEVTDGPFSPERTLLADFAPSEDDPEAGREYLQQLRKKIKGDL